MKRLSATLILILTIIGIALAQNNQPQLPKPGPEHEKLAGFVGNWVSEGEITQNPFGPAEKVSGTFKCEWYRGKFAVITHGVNKKKLSGEEHWLNVITYDADAKSYTWYSMDSSGWNGLSKATFTGDSFSAEWSVSANGKIYKDRSTYSGIGTNKRTYLEEYSEDGVTWTPFIRLTNTKVK